MRVYRLDVTYPEGSRDPGWEPPDWREGLAVDLGYVHVDREVGLEWYPDFRWPRRRFYLNRAAAENRQRLLERCGAKVEVCASDIVNWPAQ